MENNLPNQQGTDDKKLKELEKELQDLEKRAKGELQQNTQGPISQTTQTPAADVNPQAQPNNQQTKQPQPTQPTNTPPPTTSPQGTPNNQAPGGRGGMKTVLWIAFFILGLSLMGGVGYYLGSKNTAPVHTPIPTVSPTPEPTENPTQDWQTYESEDGWSMQHPSSLDVRENGAVTFVMFGPTQEEGTEFYDGISVTVRSGALGGASLMEFVNDRADEIEIDPVSELSSGPTATTVAGLSGYTLTVEGLGTFDYYYLPMGETNYIEIIDSTQDPTGEGFEDTVNQMLESLEVETPSASETATPSGTFSL